MEASWMSLSSCYCEQGRRFSPISKYTKKCLLLCFFNQTQDNEGGEIFLSGVEGKKKKKNKNISSWMCFNAPKLPGGMNLQLSPSGRSLHSHLLSNLLKNAPERKKQKEPFRLKTFQGLEEGFFLKGGKRGFFFLFLFSGEKYNTFAVSFLSQYQKNSILESIVCLFFFLINSYKIFWSMFH